MKLFNVIATRETTMVVLAEDESHAWAVAQYNARRAFDDANEPTTTCVTGEVTQASHLRSGWDTECVPYGGDGNTRISAIIEVK